jgi:hypothetical protein
MKWVWMKGGWVLALGLLGGVMGCGTSGVTPPPRNVNLYQEWSLQPGDKLAGYQVQSGLGDVAIDMKGNKVFMPFDGRVEIEAGSEDLCVIVSSPDVPAYLFRLCGLRQIRLGDRNLGDSIGHGDVIAFATLRRQADGTWAMVEPAKELITQFLEGS